MAKAVWHEVVWLPPYHCELNPIKLGLSQETRCIKNNKLLTLTTVKKLIYGEIDQIRITKWKTLFEHLQSKFENRYRFEDGLYEKSVDEFITSAGGSDDESSIGSDISSHIV